MSEYLYRVKFISGWDVEPNFTNDYPIIEQAINNTCNELENEGFTIIDVSNIFNFPIVIKYCKRIYQ